jgi:hypothetical protein
MASAKRNDVLTRGISRDLRRGLGIRRATRLSRVARDTQIPPEALLDLALELLEVLNRHLVPRSARGDAVVGLASERWRRTTPEELLAAAVKLTVVADENLTVGSGRLPAASVAPGR